MHIYPLLAGVSNFPFVSEQELSNLSERILNTTCLGKHQHRVSRQQPDSGCSIYPPITSSRLLGPTNQRDPMLVEQEGRLRAVCTTGSTWAKRLTSARCVRVTHEPQNPVTKCVRVAKARASSRTRTPTPHTYSMNIEDLVEILGDFFYVCYWASEFRIPQDSFPSHRTITSAVADIGYMPMWGNRWPTSTVGQRSIYCDIASSRGYKRLRGNCTVSLFRSLASSPMHVHVPREITSPRGRAVLCV